MAEVITTLTLAFALGFGLAKALYWIISPRRRVRLVTLLAIPPSLLLTVFLIFFKGAPEGEDWIWFFIGFSYFGPWYFAWLAGAGSEKTLRAAFTPARE